ncbi:MAG: hypothetical protein C0618_08760 [Desulfuromonas sp.]|nr:MAG: hypothetical protein C0618_08760 [Desulfuromonas sp.]
MSKNHLLICCQLSLLFCCVFFLSACSEEEAVHQAPVAVKKVQPVAKDTVQQQEELQEDTPQRFVYSPTGRRDPFEPLIKPESKVREAAVPLTPLQRFDLGQFRLQAVLIGKGEPRAMVSAPDGKTYILSPGIKIGKREGVVMEINREAVLVEEVHYDMTGTISRKVATISVPVQKSF